MSQCKWAREASRRHGGRLRPEEHDNPYMTPCNEKAVGARLPPPFPVFPNLKVDCWNLIPEKPCLYSEAAKKLSYIPPSLAL